MAGIEFSKMVEIGVVVFIILGVFGLGNALFNTIESVSDVKADISACRQSAILNERTQVPLKQTDQNSYQLFCPVTRSTYTFAQLDKLNPQQKDEMNEFGYENHIEYMADGVMWKEVRNCFAKANDGQSFLFGREWLLFSDDSSTNFCMICSLVSFDEEAQSYLGDARNANRYFLQKKTDMFRGGKIEKGTFMELVHGNSEYGTYSDVDTRYDTTETQVVMYRRINYDFTERIDLFTLNVINRLFGDEPLSYNDLEYVEIREYTNPEDIASDCEILVNTLEDGQ